MDGSRVLGAHPDLDTLLRLEVWREPLDDDWRDAVEDWFERHQSAPMHPVVDIGEGEWGTVFVREAAGGPTLPSLAPLIVSTPGVLPLEVAAALGVELADVVQRAMRAELLLDVVVPHHVIIDWSGRGWLEPPANAAYGERVGADGFAFIPAEQIRGLALTERSWVHRLGALLYLACSGRTIVDSAVEESDFTVLERIRNGETDPVSLPSALVPQLQPLLQLCLAHDVEGRPIEIDRVRDHLAELVGSDHRQVLRGFLAAVAAPRREAEHALREEVPMLTHDYVRSLPPLLDSTDGVFPMTPRPRPRPPLSESEQRARHERAQRAVHERMGAIEGARETIARLEQSIERMQRMAARTSPREQTRERD